jgi:hypothetical protein
VRVLESYRLGPHRVVVVEQLDDEELTYSVLVDGRSITDVPLPVPPSFEDVVRLYARSQDSPEKSVRGDAGQQQDEASAPPQP